MRRSKTSLAEDPLLVIHSANWMWCPVHAMASNVALLNSYGTGSTLFASFRGSSGDGGVKFTNDKLRQLSSLLETREVNLTRELTSHSLRSGAVTHVGEFTGVPISAMHNRGGVEQ